MNLLQVIGASIQLLLLLFSKWFENNKDKKKIKQEAADMVAKGLKERDPSQVTAGFDRLRNKR